MTHCVSYIPIITNPDQYQDIMGYQKDVHDAWIGLNKEFDVISTLTYETWYDISVNHFTRQEVEINDVDYHDVILDMFMGYPNKYTREYKLMEIENIRYELAHVIYLYMIDLLELIWRLKDITGCVPPIATVEYKVFEGLVTIAYDIAEVIHASIPYSV